MRLLDKECKHPYKANSSIKEELAYRVLRRPAAWSLKNRWEPMVEMGHAWEVVEALARVEDGNFFNMSLCHDSSWTASFGGDSHRVYGSSAPEAICLAACSLIGYNPEVSG